MAGKAVKDKGKDKWDFSEFDGLTTTDLLARMIYSEARGEETKGKVACAYVAKNRKEDGRFGGNTYKEVLLEKGQFVGMTTKSAREPDTDSDAWKECLDIASDLDSYDNPIGNRLYFLSYKPTSSNAKDVKKIGNQYFFNLD